jgi:hypothetical protein
MERFVGGLEKDVLSIAALDGMNERYNIFMRFVPDGSEIAADL